ncbi:MAG TPA: DUF4214 domain-containing protein [Usitatibacter sp.]|nr:DUF4214 domain-containing protein [Usitatibacter sp.]
MRTIDWTRSAALAAALAMAADSFAASLFKTLPMAKAARAPEALVLPAPVVVDREAVIALGAGGVLDADLPNGRKARVLLERIERHENGDISWSGDVLDGRRPGLRAVGTSGDAGTYAQIQTADGTWGVVPATTDHDWLFDQTASEAQLPPPANLDDAPIPPGRDEATIGPKATCPAINGMPTQHAVIDVLAVITPDFVSTHGGPAGAETRLNNIFTLMNSYNAASNIAVTYRRVATMNVAYQAASASGDDDADALDAITASSGPFRNVGALRNFYGADMVAMFRGPKNTTGNSISGIAWLNGDGNGNMPSGDSRWMYSVSGDWRFPGATLPAHELGHNLGNAHDRPNAGGGVGSTSYSYGHFVCGSGASSLCGQAGTNNTGTGFGTIMAYHRPTVPKFSSPNLMCQGTQSGAISAPCGVDNQQDDVRGTNCIRHTVANFRASWVGTCNLATDGDHDGIPDCIEAASLKNSGVRDNDVFSDPILFTAQQYRDFLGREGDADGLNFWAGEIAAGARTRSAVVESFFNSGEYQGTISPVARLYFAYFLRVPDYAGLAYWIGRFRSEGTLDGISNYFAASPEFAQKYGALDNAQFVTRIYLNVLGRAPDAQGLAYWTGQLASGARTRGQVMLGFSESAEYRALVANEVAVTMIYMGMLRRGPDGGGFSYWVDYLDRGNNGLALIDGFLASPEYRGRFL